MGVVQDGRHVDRGTATADGHVGRNDGIEGDIARSRVVGSVGREIGDDR